MKATIMETLAADVRKDNKIEKGRNGPSASVILHFLQVVLPGRAVPRGQPSGIPSTHRISKSIPGRLSTADTV